MSARARLRAAFCRGGTSKAVLFNGADLPANRAVRDRLFLHVLGSPDPYGRQLDGMGGGLSSLSKVVIVEPSARADADVDYTFVQVAVGQPVADYGSACGNMSSAVGPFAVEEGMVRADGDEALVRIHNTNTAQIYHARFPVRDGAPVEQGDFTIPGVSGSGAKVTLDFLDPAGSITSALLPTGAPRDTLHVAGLGDIEASMVDAANPVVFVRAADLGRTAAESLASLDADAALKETLDAIRRAGAVAMGMAPAPEAAALSNPKVAMIGPPAAFMGLDGRAHAPEESDISARLISMGDFHRAITLTGAMCLAVAARIPGSLAHEIARDGAAPLRIANPSGALPVTADVEMRAGQPHARSATTYRTQRRLMEGAVLVPAALTAAAP